MRKTIPAGGPQREERILDEFLGSTAYHRKYATAILRKQERPTAAKKKRQRRRTRNAELKDALTVIWQPVQPSVL